MPPEQLMQKVSSLEQQNEVLSLENAELKTQIEWFKKHVFGTGKSVPSDSDIFKRSMPCNCA